MTTVVADTEALDRPPILVDFALQGGGSHGAFTWGVLASCYHRGECLLGQPARLQEGREVAAFPQLGNA
jgi:hypothetical protein